MSVANHKRTSNEIVRNSLIVESIKMVDVIRPKVFVFENVPRFMTTICTDVDGTERQISAAIERNLGKKYSIYSKVINFKEFGASSSRSRTLVIGVRNDLADFVSPIELFPERKSIVTLKKAIGDMGRLKTMGEIDPTDVYHNFRPYPINMESWIAGLSEGQSAFENTDPNNIPHQIIDGKRVVNQEKNGDKYRRQVWDKVGPCVHTRNDQLASQNTVHPEDNRVFSIRELMKMMTVPNSFRWSAEDERSLNRLDHSLKVAHLKTHEMNIRQSLGEAVPTQIFRSIAKNFKVAFSFNYLNDKEVRSEISSENLIDLPSLLKYLKTNPKNLGFASLSRIAELANSKRHEQEAFFTDKSLVTEIIKRLPDLGTDEISVLEPSVGTGNFLPLILRHFEDKKSIDLTLYDVDKDAIKVLKTLLTHMKLPKNLKISLKSEDFLLSQDEGKFDLVIGNPPFSKSSSPELLKKYRENSGNLKAQNTAAFFIEKAIKVGGYVALVMPKFLLNTPEFASTRLQLEQKRIDTIVDFGECGFGGVLVETIAICINSSAKPRTTNVVSIKDLSRRESQQSYICDSNFPYWIIYRDDDFDSICRKMEFGIFSVFRDRQITTKMLQSSKGIRVIKSRNIQDDGSGITDIDGYDAYISQAEAENLAVYRFLNDKNVYLTPNMTYNPRVVEKPLGTLVNGSAAILILNPSEAKLTQKQMRYFSSSEYRLFYRTARNHQTRSLNVDANSVFFFGRLIH